MTTQAALHPLSVAPNGPVFDLPIHVALEHGLFEKRGLAVRFAEKYNAQVSSADAFQRQKESLYEDGKADTYNLCEWAGLDRSERGNRDSVVHALRPAVVAQVILTFDENIQELRDLATVPVAMIDPLLLRPLAPMTPNASSATTLIVPALVTLLPY